MYRFSLKNIRMSQYTALLTGLVLVAGSVFLYGCDGPLTQQPRGQLSGDVIETQQGLETVLVGAYNALNAVVPPPGNPQGVAGGNAWRSDPSHWPFGAVSSDIAQKGSADFDQSPMNAIMQHRWNPTNSYFNPLWANRFEGVSRANSVLSSVSQVENIPEEEANRIRAEARFLRAYFYFDLKKNFGNVPLITEETEDLNQPNNVEDEIIWPQIESDLKFAVNNLPVTMPEHTRVNKWAAAAYLAKAYVFQEKWDAARGLYQGTSQEAGDLDLGSGIIDDGATSSGVPYELEEQYNYNFNSARQGEEWSEAVFAVEMTANDGTGSNSNAWAGTVLNYPHGVAPFNCCGFFQPSHDLVNSFKTTSEGVPRPDGFTEGFNGMDEVLKNDQYPDNITSSEQFAPASNASLDPRLDWTTGRRGVPFLDHGPHPGKRYDRAGHDYAGPYHSKKHVWWNRNSDVGWNDQAFFPASGVDYPTMRFAGVLLMAAEAEINAGGGSVSQALSYVNRVRTRAANPNGFVQNRDNEAQALATVNSESAMLDTDPSQFDWVVRTDENATYTFLGGDAGDIGNWNQYPDPTNNYNIDTYTMSEFESAPGPLRRVHFERKLELAMEGHRMYDLWRWERAETRMNDYFAYQGGLTTDVEGGSYRGADVYPIPQTQIDISTVDGEQVLTQNPQY